MAIVTTNLLPPQVRQAYSRQLLSVEVPNTIHGIPADVKSMPAKSGDTMRFRRYNKLATAKVPLGNSGVTPRAQVLSAVDIDVKMQFYGTWLAINEQTLLQNQEYVLNEAIIQLGLSLRETEDELTRDMLASTCSFVNCVGGVNADNPSEISRSDIDDIATALFSHSAKTFLDGFMGSEKYGSSAVRDAYFGLCSSDLTSDLSAVNGFTHKNQYAVDAGLPSEFGSAGNVRFLASPLGSKTVLASNKGNTVYNVFYVAREAYAVVEQDEYGEQFTFLPKQFSGPLAMNVSVGWKMAYASRIFNDAWVVNGRCTLSR